MSGSYSQLASTNSTAVDVSGANQLTAICQSVAGQQPVRLAFAVNGRQFLSLTDRANPLGSGTVGVFTNFYGVSITNGVTSSVAAAGAIMSTVGKPVLGDTTGSLPAFGEVGEPLRAALDRCSRGIEQHRSDDRDHSDTRQAKPDDNAAEIRQDPD